MKVCEFFFVREGLDWIGLEGGHHHVSLLAQVLAPKCRIKSPMKQWGLGVVYSLGRAKNVPLDKAKGGD
jgi:hypothetical protein